MNLHNPFTVANNATATFNGNYFDQHFVGGGPWQNATSASFDESALGKLVLQLKTQGIKVTKDTTLVIESNGSQKAFDGKNSEKEALDYADERADATRGTVYLLRPFKSVAPERKTKVTDL